MLRRVIYLLLPLAIVACGKNDGVRALPYGPAPAPGSPYFMPQAPAPGGGFAPAPQFPNGGGYYGGGYNPYFYPQQPTGYGQQYYPFLPIHNYMMQNPYRQNYWQQHWNGWQQYAGQHGYNQYDFNRFWFDYCPQQWSYTEWAPMYNYYDQNFYFWATPQTQYAPTADPGYFWQNYNGYSYQPLDNYYCYDYCY